MSAPSALSDRDFAGFQRFIYAATGISLSSSKKALVVGRLARRIATHNLASYGAYLELVESGSRPEETQEAIDLLTTNETYFFRESKQFEVMKEAARSSRTGQEYRVWSAASSTGEEAYSLAMVLADCRAGRPWSVFGSDISTRVLSRAMAAHYPMERARNMPPEYLQRFCLKGTAQYEGSLLIDRALRSRVSFAQVNLNEPLPAVGEFDAIFLRNVLIYFDPETKRRVVERVLGQLRPGGHFFLGHAEGLGDLSLAVRTIGPATYLKV